MADERARLLRLEDALKQAVKELKQGLVQIALLESEVIAFRGVAGTLLAEVVRRDSNPQMAMAQVAGHLLASAGALARHGQGGDRRLLFERYTEAMEAVIASAEEALTRPRG